MRRVVTVEGVGAEASTFAPNTAREPAPAPAQRPAAVNATPAANAAYLIRGADSIGMAGGLRVPAGSGPLGTRR